MAEKKEDLDARRQQARIVKGLLTKLAKDLKKDGAKSTLADYIRLVQLQKDLDKDEPRDIKVGWVDHLEKDAEK